MDSLLQQRHDVGEVDVEPIVEGEGDRRLFAAEERHHSGYSQRTNLIYFRESVISGSSRTVKKYRRRNGPVSRVKSQEKTDGVALHR
jgi:hypothetical protein